MKTEKPAYQLSKLLRGDWLVVIASLAVVFFLFQQLWVLESPSQLKIRQGDKIIGIYDLKQTRRLHIHGALGDSIIAIQQSKVRFVRSPCNNQYCVHQGWLNRAGQIAICLPNQISLQLIGANSPYDSLNY